MEDIKCDLQVAVSWAVSSKNYRKKVHGFSPNQLVLGKNLNCPNICDDLLPALENKTSEIVAKNLNALHQARQNYIKTESSSKIKQALRHQVRTYSGVMYNAGDLVYYKRKGNLNWKGPASVIGRDGQQVLVKHGSRYKRVHPCNLQLGNSNLYENKHSFPSDIDSSTSSLEKGPSVVTDDFQNVKVLFDNEKMGGNDNMFDNEVICPIDGESDKNENILNSEDVTDIIDIQQNTDQNTSIENEGCYHNNQKHPKVKDFVEYKIFGSNDFQKAQIIKRAGKVSGKYSDWYNIKNVNDDTISSIDWKSVDKWKQYSQEEALINSLVNNFSDFDFIKC